MPSIPAGFCEATLIWNLAGSIKDMTTAIGLDPAADPDADPSQIAEEVYEAATFTGSLVAAGGMGEEWTFSGVSVTKQLESGPITGQFFDSVQGTVTSDGLICNTAVLVTKRTSLGGRRNRGRCYQPPANIAEVNVNAAGVIDGIVVGLENVKWGVFYTRLLTYPWQPVLFHQEAPFTPTEVTGFTVGSLCATQRRRMRG